MNKTALLFGVGASLILAAGAANAAGSCGAEVADLQQQLGAQDTASTTTGPTDDQIATDNDANATIGATDPGVQQPMPEANATTGTSTTTTTDPGVQQPMPEANATTGTSTTTTTDPGVQQPQSGDSDTLADSSSSSSSSTTMPSGTVTETSRVGDLNTAAGGRAEAITALKKAQMAADAGDEDACMTELGTAKAALGVE
jgi:hypothetical protein